MVRKYADALEGRELNTRTGEIWAIQDVPAIWRKSTERQVKAEGYIILEDGTVDKPEPNDDDESEL